METSILSAYSKNECQKYFDYLERLRQSLKKKTDKIRRTIEVSKTRTRFGSVEFQNPCLFIA
jgi:predicted ATPase with chaperone activity